MGENTELHSVDISERYYRDGSKPTGFMAEENCSSEQLSRWHRHFGRDVIHFLDDIGPGVDFLVLDSAHVLPGELLSYLALSQILEDNCIVILHDILLNYYFSSTPENINTYWDTCCESYCTNLLLGSVYSHSKMILPDSLSTIGAFVHSKSSNLHAFPLFLNLFLPWKYMPLPEDIEKYKSLISGKYPKQCLFYFCECVKYQQLVLEHRNNIAQAAQNTLENTPCPPTPQEDCTQDVNSILCELNQCRDLIAKLQGELFKYKNEKNAFLNEILKLYLAGKKDDFNNI